MRITHFQCQWRVPVEWFTYGVIIIYYFYQYSMNTFKKDTRRLFPLIILKRCLPFPIVTYQTETLWTHARTFESTKKCMFLLFRWRCEKIFPKIYNTPKVCCVCKAIFFHFMVHVVNTGYMNCDTMQTRFTITATPNDQETKYHQIHQILN